MPVRPALPPRDDRGLPPRSGGLRAAAATRCRSTPRCGARRLAVTAPPPAAATPDRPFAVLHRRQRHRPARHAGPRRRATPESGDPAVDEAVRRGRRRRWRCSPRSSAARRTTAQGAPVLATVHYEPGLRQRLLGRHPAGVRRRRREGVRPVHQAGRRARPRAHPRGHPVHRRPRPTRASPARSTSRSPTCFGSCLKQRLLGADRRPGRLADRRGHLPAAVHGTGAALDGGPGHGLRRPDARQGPAGRLDGRLRRHHRRQRRGAHSTPASPTGPSTSRRPALGGQLVGGRRQDLVRRAHLGHRRRHRLRGLRGRDGRGGGSRLRGRRRSGPVSLDAGRRGRVDSGRGPALSGTGRRVAVTRTGGFAGCGRAGEITLGDDPRTAEVESCWAGSTCAAWRRTGPSRTASSTASTSTARVTVGEQDLTPDLEQLTRLLLD